MMSAMIMMMICSGYSIGRRGVLDVWFVAVLALLYASTCCHCLLYTHPHLHGDVYNSMNNRPSRWMGGHVLRSSSSSSSSSSRSNVLLASRSRDYSKVNNDLWQIDSSKLLSSHLLLGDVHCLIVI